MVLHKEDSLATGPLQLPSQSKLFVRQRSCFLSDIELIDEHPGHSKL